jgi:hypothetical protein
MHTLLLLLFVVVVAVVCVFVCACMHTREECCKWLQRLAQKEDGQFRTGEVLVKIKLSPYRDYTYTNYHMVSHTEKFGHICSDLTRFIKVYLHL